MAAASDIQPKGDLELVCSGPSRDDGKWGPNISEHLVRIFTDIMYSDAKNSHQCKLFDFLVDPRCTANEFDIVIREEASKFFKFSRSQNSRFKIYFGKVAAEALAVRCWKIEYSWERVTWNIVKYCFDYKSSQYGFVSTKLSEWIVKMIGNAELCPCPYLRIQLMILLKNMVEINNENHMYVFDSVMSAFCGLRADFLVNRDSHESKCKYIDSETLNPSDDKNGVPVITIRNIFQILLKFTKFGLIGYMVDFDKIISLKLKNMTNSRVSAILGDVSYKYGVNEFAFIYPRELYSLIALLKFTVGFAQDVLEVKPEEPVCIYELKPAVQLLHFLIERFSISCQTPQLISLASSCIIDMLEALLLCSSEAYDDEVHEALKSLEWMLKKPNVAEKIIEDHHSQVQGKLKNIRDSWYNMNKDKEYYDDPSLRYMIKVESHSQFTSICKLVFNETFNGDNKPDFSSELRMMSHSERVSNNEMSSDNEMTASNEMSDSEVSADNDLDISLY